MQHATDSSSRCFSTTPQLRTEQSTSQAFILVQFLFVLITPMLRQVSYQLPHPAIQIAFAPQPLTSIGDPTPKLRNVLEAVRIAHDNSNVSVQHRSTHIFHPCISLIPTVACLTSLPCPNHLAIRLVRTLFTILFIHVHPTVLKPGAARSRPTGAYHPSQTVVRIIPLSR
jgi:hypothetical protein